MARLPIPGADSGTWGDVLNQYLLTSHNADGTLNANAVPSGALQDGSVTAPKLSATGGTTGLVLVNDQTVEGGMKWDVVTSGSSTPTGPAGGDLAGTYPNPTVPGMAAKANDNAVVHLAATETITGAKNFTGGLSTGGKAVVDTSDSRLSDQRTPTDGSVTTVKIVDANVTEAKLSSAVQTKLNTIAPVTSVAGKTGAVTLVKGDVGLGNVDNTSDASKPISSATQTALNAKADDSAVVHNTTNETVAGIKTFSSSPIVPTPTSNTQAANKSYVDGVAGAGAPDASPTVKGILKLSGDLGGTADTPTVPGLAGKADNTVTVTGGTSLAGGGDLSTSRTLTLVNDSATPGAGMYYGTDNGGAKGYHVLPAGGGGGGVFTSVAWTTGQGDYSASSYDFVIGDATNGLFHVVLPVASDGAWVRVKKIDSTGNAILVKAQAGNVDGSASYSVNSQWQSQDFASDGTTWYCI